jgi:hypothetical protein
MANILTFLLLLRVIFHSIQSVICKNCSMIGNGNEVAIIRSRIHVISKLPRTFTTFINDKR